MAWAAGAAGLGLEQHGWLLAQSSSPTGKILLWVFVLIIIIVVGGLLVVELRRRLLGKQRDTGVAGLMEDIRSMRTRGELSQEEFDRIRKRMAARAAGKDPEEVAPAEPMPEPGVVRAKPGYDLTGERLPESGFGTMPGPKPIDDQPSAPPAPPPGAPETSGSDPGADRASPIDPSESPDDGPEDDR